MKAIVSEILKYFPKIKDERVTKSLEDVVLDLNKKNIPISDYTKIILQMLAIQYTLYYKAVDEMIENQSVTTTDSYKRNAKRPEIGIMQKCTEQILNLMDKLTLSPLSSAKVKKLKETTEKTESATDLLDALINS